MHSLKPVIAIWDDHEFSDNSYMSGAANHTEGTEGVWSDRVNYALQAYHEWMPIRTGGNRRKIYRTFNWGNLVNLHMLDTRLIGRDQQINLLAYLGVLGGGAQASAVAAYISSTREMLGQEQNTWLFNEMTANTGTWTVLGQQVAMGRIEFPSTVLAAAAPALTPGATVTNTDLINLNNAATTYLTAKAKVDAGLGSTLTVSESGAYYSPKVPYNLDSWDGYIYAREKLLTKTVELNKNLITLSGDVHNAFYNDLTLKGLAGVTGSTGGFLVGREFITTSISAPGFESYIPIGDTGVSTLFGQIPDDVNWLDPSKRGYLKVTFTPTQVVADWPLLNTVRSTSYTVSAAPTRTVAKTY
jgi:alkaline phosphatase D